MEKELRIIISNNDKARDDTAPSRTFYDRRMSLMALSRQNLFHGTTTGFLNPYSFFRKYWDGMVYLFSVYSAIEVPYRVGFDLPPNTSIVVGIYLMLDIVYLLDIVLKFLTPPTPEISRKRTAWLYFTSWFFVDLLCVVPFWAILGPNIHDLNLVSANLDTVNVSMNTQKLARLLEFSALARLSHVQRIMLHWQSYYYINRGIQEAMSFAFLMVIVAHVMACLWFFASSIFGFSRITWVDVYYPEHDMSTHPADWWASDDTYNRFNWYFASLYWSVTTITTVGYGDIAPFNDFERVVASLAMLIGAGCYGYVIGNMHKLMKYLDPFSKEHADKMAAVNRYLKHRKLPRDMCSSIRTFYNNTFRQKRLMGRDRLILKELSMALRGQVMASMLHRFPLLAEVDEDFLKIFALRLDVRIYDANEFVVEEGSVCSEMYFLIKGSVLIVSGSKVIATQHENSYFGEVAILSKDHRRSAGVQALEMCEVYAMKSEGMMLLAQKQYPIYRRLYDSALSRKNAADLLQPLLPNEKIPSSYFASVISTPYEAPDSVMAPVTPVDNQSLGGGGNSNLEFRLLRIERSLSDLTHRRGVDITSGDHIDTGNSSRDISARALFVQEVLPAIDSLTAQVRQQTIALGELSSSVKANRVDALASQQDVLLLLQGLHDSHEQLVNSLSVAKNDGLALTTSGLESSAKSMMDSLRTQSQSLRQC